MALIWRASICGLWSSGMDTSALIGGPSTRYGGTVDCPPDPGPAAGAIKTSAGKSCNKKRAGSVVINDGLQLQNILLQYI